MKLVYFRHVAKQDVLLAEQGAGDEVSQGRVVHLCSVALEINITHITSADALSFTVIPPVNAGIGPSHI